MLEPLIVLPINNDVKDCDSLPKRTRGLYGLQLLLLSYNANECRSVFQRVSARQYVALNRHAQRSACHLVSRGWTVSHSLRWGGTYCSLSPVDIKAVFVSVRDDVCVRVCVLWVVRVRVRRLVLVAAFACRRQVDEDPMVV